MPRAPSPAPDSQSATHHFITSRSARPVSASSRLVVGLVGGPMVRLILSGLVCLLAVNLVLAQQVTYIYDELGRLVGVIDPNGEAATYEYDAVGNILSIGRIPASTLKIIEFTPDKGPAGTQVTIHGKGFSGVPGQNTVKFSNNKTATVISESPTELTVEVPSMAFTGPIKVEAQSQTDTSTSDFVIASDDTPPAIVSFSPSIVAPGETVTIIGDNFSADPTANLVLFNSTHAGIALSTTTSLDAIVPPTAGSGRITLSTVVDTAISMDDLFIPPTLSTQITSKSRAGYPSVRRILCLLRLPER